MLVSRPTVAADVFVSRVTVATVSLVNARAPSAGAVGTTSDEEAAGAPSAACACSPQRNPSANNPPTSRTTCSARRPAAVRITRRAALGKAAGQVKRGWSSRAAERISRNEP